jgi:hypothetical protein
MNTITKISTAIVLGLGLTGGASLAADAANARPTAHAGHTQAGGVSYPRGQVIQLGTITVTPADMGGPRTAAHRDGTVFLGSITVTPAASAGARYASSPTQPAGTVFLGTVSVTARNHKLPVIGSLLAAIDAVGSRNLLSVVGALVFSRMPG